MGLLGTLFRGHNTIRILLPRLGVRGIATPQCAEVGQIYIYIYIYMYIYIYISVLTNDVCLKSNSNGILQVSTMFPRALKSRSCEAAA